MKKWILICILLIAVSVIITGCDYLGKNKLEFSSNGILLMYSWKPAGETTVDNMYDRITKIYNDGKVDVFHDDQFIRSFDINSSNIKKLQDKIVEVKFMELEEDIDTNTYDGSYHYITVYTETATHTSGGLNPDNSKFKKLKDIIEDIVQ